MCQPVVLRSFAMISKKLFLAAILVATLILVAAPRQLQAQTVFVSDQFEVMLRRGPSIKNAIIRVLESGDQLETLEVDSDAGYTRVRTPGGTEGWVLTRYLMDNAAARSQLAALQARVASLRNESGDQGKALDDLRQRDAASKQRIAELESEGKQLAAELADIRRTASDVLRINNENKQLRESLSDAEIKINTLEQENDRLASRSQQNWFLIGAAVLSVGILLGLVLPRIPRHRRGRYRDSL